MKHQSIDQFFCRFKFFIKMMKLISLKQVFLVLFFLAIFCLSCSTSYAKGSIKNDVISRSRRSTMACLDAKRECKQNKTCFALFTSIRRHCKFVKSNCRNLKSQAPSQRSEKPEDDMSKQDTTPAETRESCTNYINELRMLDMFQTQCTCSSLSSSRSSRKRKNCQNMSNMIFANPCYVPKFDFLGNPKYSIETYDVKNEIQFPNFNPNAISEHSTSDKFNFETLEPFTVEIQLEIGQNSGQKNGYIYGSTEETTAIKQSHSSTSYDMNYEPTKGSDSLSKDCNSNSHHEDILIIAFMISGAALVLFILLGVGVCCKKWKNKKNSGSVYDKSEQPDVVVRLTSSENRQTLQKVSNRI